MKVAAEHYKISVLLRKKAGGFVCTIPSCFNGAARLPTGGEAQREKSFQSSTITPHLTGHLFTAHIADENEHNSSRHKVIWQLRPALSHAAITDLI